MTTFVTRIAAIEFQFAGIDGSCDAIRIIAKCNSHQTAIFAKRQQFDALPRARLFRGVTA